MMKTKQSSHAIAGAFVFLLLGVFAVFSTVMVVLGARAYRSGIDRAAQNNARRIASAYVRSMVRSDDEADAVRVEESNGGDVIVLENNYDGDVYLTRMYVWDGSLREWYASGDMPFAPEDGETVCPAEEIKASIEDGLLLVRLLYGGEWTEVILSLRAAL